VLLLLVEQILERIHGRHPSQRGITFELVGGRIRFRRERRAAVRPTAACHRQAAWADVVEDRRLDP